MSEVKRYVTSEFMGLAPHCSQCEPNVDACEFVLASDYDALRAEVERERGVSMEYVEQRNEALVRAERAEAEVERLRAELTKWDNSLCGCCCHACTELGNVADWLPDPTPASPASTTDA